MRLFQYSSVSHSSARMRAIAGMSEDCASRNLRVAMRGERRSIEFRPAGQIVRVCVLAVRRRHRRRMPARRHLRDFRFMHRLHWRTQRAAAHVIADRLQPLQNSLPLRPVKLTQERTQALDEWIFEQGLASGFGHEEPIQPDAQSFGDFFECAEAGSHLPALNTREIRTGDARLRLKLALRHPARLAQLANALPDVLDGLAVRPVFRGLRFPRRLLRRRSRDNESNPRRQQAHTTTAIIRLCAILHEAAHTTTDYFSIHFRNTFLSFLFSHRSSSQTFPAARRGGTFHKGEGRNRRDGHSLQRTNPSQVFFSRSPDFASGQDSNLTARRKAMVLALQQASCEPRRVFDTLFALR